ncbi:2-dehydropantoate 2-reductase [Mycolicibacterium agri]|uniref:2-dehydropantoate 2-reductase n=1 Tax=Mycolicibacterium agri TaxID=36811 RepID=A0A2A7N2Y9_MYCAG|nr:oxidoreductase [Mycolicibacterium agri]PEG38200.1 2-dehydropantoate 2-reductase [Mycolicibacterium agri]GFG49334.1 putative 2-dehydropantoate 2-reductase [Mycolicibacterium agri]
MGTSIAVVGPGAIGATMAALLHTAGHQVVLCGRTPRDHIEVKPHRKDPIVVPGPVHTDPADVDGSVDVVLVAVKDTQNQDSAGWLAKLCDQRTVVYALQNGVEQIERVGPLCPSSTVVPAVVWFSAEPHPEGGIWLRTGVRLVLPEGAASQTLADLLRDTGATVELEPDFVTEAWRKLLVNAVADLMVLTGRRSGMFRRDDIAALSRRYLAECLAVARAEGANLGDEVIDQVIDLFVSKTDITTSALTDRLAGRPLEWDIRNGVISRKGAQHGIATPISDGVVALLAAASDGPG